MINIDDIAEVRNIIVINDTVHHQHRHHHANLCDTIFGPFPRFFPLRNAHFPIRSLNTNGRILLGRRRRRSSPSPSHNGGSYAVSATTMINCFCTFLSLILFFSFSFCLLWMFLRYCTRLLTLLATACYHSGCLSVIIVHVVLLWWCNFLFCLFFFLLVVLHVCVYVCYLFFCISLLTYTRVFD